MQITREAHLKIAFMTWALVGTGLLVFGMNTLFGRSLGVLNDGSTHSGFAEAVGVVVALTIGFLKGNFILKKVALKYISRIQMLSEMSPFYMTFAPKNWILVVGMMSLGKLIRTFASSHLVIGVIYVTVGFALVLGARTYLMGSQIAPAEV